jgi:hypothetical protein
LGDTGAIANVDEDEGTEVTAAIDPSHKDRFFAGISGAECPTHVSTSQIA